MVRGARCREINLRIRRREKNVLDIPFYKSGDYAQIPFTSERAAGSKQAKGILVSAVLELLREHSLTIFLVATGVGWVIAFGAMDSETK